VLWLQDFPAAATTTAAAAAAAAPRQPLLPPIAQDPQQLRRTLRCFTDALFKATTAPLEGGLAVEKRLKVRVAACFAGVDTSGARATVLASIPTASELPVEWNGIHGLGTALGTLAWPEAAAGAPITALAGSLGDPANGEWVRDLVCGMTGRGAHGPLPALDGPAPGLRILFPTNATAFRCGFGACVCVWVCGWLCGCMRVCVWGG
jgi:hypothetical protein